MVSNILNIAFHLKTATFFVFIYIYLGKKHPRVPIKTYKWEDVYRSRRKGGYPWTHLYKEPFGEELYPEQYTMDALRRSKSNSTFDKSERSDGVEIEEIFDDESNLSTAGSTAKQCIEVTEPDVDSKSDKLLEPKRLQIFTIESAESLDNISQYLDNEPEKENVPVKPKEQPSTARATSEEPRKRKLSGESSYSRLSLPKFAAFKKLTKRKLPKISFPTSNIKRSKAPKKSSPTQVKKETKLRAVDYTNVKAEYIHIPLKPPPGEQDEFSYLEFGEKKPDVAEKPSQPSFKDLVKAIKAVEDAKKTLEKDDGVEVMDFTLQEPEEEKADKPEEVPKEKVQEEIKKGAEEADNKQELKEEAKKTFPKLFKTKSKTISSEPYNTTKTTIRIPLHSEQSMENENGKQDQEKTKQTEAIAMKEAENKNVEEMEPKTKTEDLKLKEPEALAEEPQIKEESKKLLSKFFKKPTAKKESKKISSEALKYNTAEDTIRIPLHSEDSIDNSLDTSHDSEKEQESKKTKDTENKTSESKIEKVQIKEPETKDESKKETRTENVEIKELEPIVIEPQIKEEKKTFPMFFNTPISKKQSKKISSEPLKYSTTKDTIRIPLHSEDSMDNGIETPDSEDIKIEPTQQLEEILAKKLKEKISSPSVDETEPESEPEVNNDFFDKLFEKPPPVPETSQVKKTNVRAKSAEPERKRKMSMESSYSKKSTSSTLKKKFKNVKDKIKFPSLGNLLPKKTPKPEKKEEKLPTKQEKKELKPMKFVEPVYIHIPLKPVEGEADEYSHVESETALKIKVNVDAEKPDEESTMSSPDSVKEGVQFIYLTAPSDDEILDAPDVPDTPSSDKFFGSDIIELKVLAKDIVDEISPQTKRKVLDPVSEEIPDDKSDEFDKEDGLKISGPECSKTEQLKSNLKQEGSPLLNRKKVSFKRKSKESKDDDYEEVLPSDDSLRKSTQSLTLPEQEHEKDEKIKEDLFPESAPKWSEISDHEYEPVNPPPEETKAPQPQPQPQHQQPVPPQDNIIILDTREEVAVIPIVDPVSPPTTIEKHVTVTTHETPLPSSYISSSQSSRARSEDLEDLDCAPKESKFKNAMKIKADQFKTKLQSIKKPNIHLPNRPKFHKPNMEKFKLNLPNFPKIPDTIKINLPHRSTTKIIKERQESTESNVGDSKKHTFDFKTYPRFFKRKSKDEGISSSQVTSSAGRSKSIERSVLPSGYEGSGESEAKKTFDFSTFPRLFKKTAPKQDSQKLSSSDSPSEQPMRSRSYDREIIRVPLHSEDSTENGYNQEKPEYHIEEEDNNSPSLIRYNEDIDIEDDYNRENVEVPDDFTNRWSHGRFITKVTDLDSPESQNPHESFDMSHNTDPHSSQSSIDVRRRGVLEEINSDEFFLRQKGISQDNIEVGKYLSSEIKEAFKVPKNSLSDMQRENYESYDLGSNQSLPEVQVKKKPARKPRRKKTPHASEEQIKYHEYDLDIENQEQPTRPKRTSSKSKNIDVLNETDIREIMQRYASDSFDRPYYENDKMRNINQPDIYLDRGSDDFNINYASGFDGQPQPPPRKHRSMKSLNMSEHESIMGDFEDKHAGPYQGSYADEGYDDDSRFIRKYLEASEEMPPVRPKRRSNSRSKSSQNRSTSEIQSIPDIQSEQPVEEVIQEPCVKVLGDYMGYSIVDKSKRRDPPLPPPRTPPRRRRSLKSTSSERFSTVPRSSHDGPPTRPLRNYSTLGHIRSSRKSSLKDNNEKENIDMSQYIEVEDEYAAKSLVSGEVIQKMRDRPLPAPPRPPRSKTHKSKPFKDITSQQNLAEHINEEEKEISTQTDPVPDDFECEEVRQPEVDEEVCIVNEEPKLNVAVEKPREIIRERVLILPGHYSFEETVTHGSLVVEPLNGAKIIDDSELTKQERIIPVTQEEDDSKVPDEFYLLKDPEPAPSRKKREAPRFEHIDELDVGRLRVHELMADKLSVSEIDAENIQVNQLNAKSGTIEIPQGVIEEMIKKARSEEVKYETIPEKKEDDSLDKKKRRCSPENVYLEIEESIDHSISTHYYEEPVPPTPPPRTIEDVPLNLDHLESEIVPSTSPPRETQEVSLELESENNEPPFPLPKAMEEAPVKPPRRLEEINFNQEPDKPEPPTPPPRAMEEIPLRPPRLYKTTDNSDAGTIAEPEVDDQPPPRPPQPITGYIPSQPPASFYALRAQKYVDSQMEGIPSAPRRRRHQRRVSRSTSEESLPVHPSRKHLRSPEPSIPQLTGQLIQACGSAGNSALKRLIAHIRENVMRNQDGQQDMHVIVIILLVLIAGLLLLGIGDDKTVVHLHHWEYFNPPKDM
ncbi:unnamed protein product [Brassicogethes aeneus]|uniref:Uncharacterized protein n=1 Tax=Brassicogethes aeneus TaxID=1431903 RepID=A0A9P0ARJ9_BRAAE|nr:unnamed protein product [Brassicogethes aeneus]